MKSPDNSVGKMGWQEFVRRSHTLPSAAAQALLAPEELEKYQKFLQTPTTFDKRRPTGFPDDVFGDGNPPKMV